MAAYIKPKRLKKGDRVAIIAPSSPFRKEEFKSGLALLQQRYNVIYDSDIFSSYGYLAGSDKRRKEELLKYLYEPEIRAIFTARGGYGVLRIISEIDFGYIKKIPKIIVGFSDITALHMAIVAKSMICTIHGPNILQIPKLSLAARTHLFKLIEQSKPLGKLSLSDLQVISNGVAQGILIGGNLSLISHLVGTQFFPCPKDKILFLEDIDEPPYKIDRMLTHLILSDILTQVRGIILGDFSKCKSRSGNSFSVFEVLRERLQGLGIPVLSGFKAGHIPSNLALPMGCQVRLECTDKGAQLSFEESPCI